MGRAATLAGLCSICGLLSARVKRVDVVGNSWAKQGGIVGTAVSVLMLSYFLSGLYKSRRHKNEEGAPNGKGRWRQYIGEIGTSNIKLV